MTGTDPAIQTIVFSAMDQRLGTSSTARLENRIVFADAPPGFAIWGPYVSLGKGRYEACFALGRDAPVRGRLVLDACADGGSVSLGAIQIDLEDPTQNNGLLSLTFTLDRQYFDVEVRLRGTTDFSCQVSHLEIRCDLPYGRALALLGRHLERDIVAADVGARWTIPAAWTAIADRLRVIGFEPDAEECARLNAAGNRNMVFHPTALGARNGQTTLHLTREPACSSVYPPNRTLYTQYPGLEPIEPVKAIEVACKTLDTVCAEIDISTLDILKLDTQGSELDVLRGARDILGTTSFIDVEVEFNPIYDGQNLYHEVDKFLRDSGFVLWRFHELCHYAPSDSRGLRHPFHIHHSVGTTRTSTLHVYQGQLFWAQAHYVRKEFTRWAQGSFNGDPVAAAGVMALYGYWDIAADVLQKFGDPALFRQLTDLV